MMVLMRSMGRNLMGEFFSDRDMALEMFSSSFARSVGRPFFTLKTRTRWLASVIAVEHGHQLHQAAHAALAVEHEEKIGGAVNVDAGILALKRLQNLGQLVGSNVLEEDQIQHRSVVFRDAVGVRLRFRRYGEMRNIGERDDAIQLALLHHAEAVDPQNGFQQRARVDILRFAVGVEDDAAFDARIENVVDLELLRQQIDHFGERRVIERQTAINGGRSGGSCGCGAGWRLGTGGGSRCLLLGRLRPAADAA